MRRILHAFLLTLFFLFAQAGVLAHAASHSMLLQGSDPSLPADKPCELCVGYAQLAGSAPLPTELRLPVCAVSHEIPLPATTVLASRTTLHACARAPPAFS